MVFDKSMEAFREYNALGGEGVYLHVTKDDRVILVRDSAIASTPQRIGQALKKVLEVLQSHQAPQPHVATLKNYAEVMRQKASIEALKGYTAQKGRTVYLHVTSEGQLLLV